MVKWGSTETFALVGREKECLHGSFFLFDRLELSPKLRVSTLGTMLMYRGKVDVDPKEHHPFGAALMVT